MKKTTISLALVTSFVASAGSYNLAATKTVDQRATASVQSVNNIQRVPHRGGGIFFEDFQTQADPANPVLPAGWLVFDVDGQTPNGQVAQFTEAWIAAADFGDATNFTAMSTSWYSPAGQSNDWLITPAVMLGANTVLSWRALAQDSNFPDGYEVYVSTSTQDVAGCLANPAVFTIANENAGPAFTDRTVNLNDAGFANQMVHICYRNNSNDQFVLVLDEVGLAEVFNNDVRIDGIAMAPEYTQVPDKQPAVDIPLLVNFTNTGEMDQSNISVQAEVYLDMLLTDTITDVFTGPLVTGASDSLDLGSYSTTTTGVYDVVYTLSLDGVTDENPANNEAEILAVEITSDVMARDDAVEAGRLGIGAQDGGYLGNMFELTAEATLSGVEFVYSNDNCDLNAPFACSMDGESIQVDVFTINGGTGLPDVMIASTEAHVIPVGTSESVVVVVDFTNPLNLAPGQYVFAVTEPVRTVSTFGTIILGLSYSNNRYTQGAAWVDWPSNPNGVWVNSETLGFPVSYYIRPQFVETDVIFRDGFNP